MKVQSKSKLKGTLSRSSSRPYRLYAFATLDAIDMYDIQDTLHDTRVFALEMPVVKDGPKSKLYFQVCCVCVCVCVCVSVCLFAKTFALHIG